MNDADFEAMQKRIRDIFYRWRDALGLDQWHVDLTYWRDTGEYETAHGACSAKAETHWQYLIASLHFNALTLENMDEDYLEYVVVHECCHILVAEMPHVADAASDHEERVVTQLARAFIRTRDAARDA